MSDYKDRVAGRGLYDEKFYDSLREVKRLLERYDSEVSKSSSIQQSNTGGSLDSNSQRNIARQPANALPAQRQLGDPARPLDARHPPQATTPRRIDFDIPLEVFIDYSWQFRWEREFYHCNWPDCDRHYRREETMRRHRATHDQDRYRAGEIPLPSYPQPDLHHTASATGGPEITLPLR